MSDEFTRDLAELTQALRDEADQCELLGINKPAALLRDAAAVIQMDANMQAMDEFAEVTSAGHLSELVHEMRRKLHMLADDWQGRCDYLNPEAAAATLREIAGDRHPTLPLLPPDEPIKDVFGNEWPCAGAPSPAEFEVRADGKTVRRDRWEVAVRRIVALLWGNRREFEVDEVVEAVRALVPQPFNEGDDEGLVRAVLGAAPAERGERGEQTAQGVELPPLPVPWKVVQDADGFDVQVFRVFQMRDYARAALSAAPGVPRGWRIERESTTGGIVVVTPSGDACVVYEAETEPRTIPASVLHELAAAMLAAAPQHEGGA